MAVHLPMDNFFGLGISHYNAFAYDDGDTILGTLEALARDTDIAAIEVTSFGANIVHKAAARLLAHSGMRVLFDATPRLNASGLNPCALDDAPREKALAALKECVDEAEMLGAALLTFRSGACPRGREMDALSRLLSVSNALAEYAKSGGITVNVEVCDFDADIGALIGPSNLARSFAAQMREAQPDFGLTVNSAHLPFFPGTMRDKIGPIKDYITHARMGNTVTERGDPAYGDKHARFGYPGGALGKKELVEYLRTLVFIRYLDADKQDKPVLSLTVSPVEGEDPLRLIAGAKRALKEAWAIV